MRVLIAIVLLSSLIFAKNTTAKIKDSKKELANSQYKERLAKRKLKEISEDIKKNEKEIDNLEDKIDALDEKQDEEEKKYDNLKKQSIKSKKELEETRKELEKKQDKLNTLLTEQFALVFAIEKSYEPTRESILNQEIYRTYKKENEKKIISLKKDILRVQERKREQEKSLIAIKKEIKKIEKDKKYFTSIKNRKERILKRLVKDENLYSKKLNAFDKRQNIIERELSKLKIRRKKEIQARKERLRKKRLLLKKERARKARLRKARLENRRKARLAKRKLKYAKTKKEKELARKKLIEAKKRRKSLNKERTKVRKINTSYVPPKLYKYRGRKTSSPLKRSKLIRGFGTYKDKHYGIKAFSEEIILKRLGSDNRVYNVLDGKVEYAKNSSMLGKVVVVKHRGRIHTIYSGLSVIAPNIKTGQRVKRNTILGKIHKKLGFQATKGSKHINPLRLIRI